MGVLKSLRKGSKSEESIHASPYWTEFDAQAQTTNSGVPVALDYLTSQIRRHVEVEGLFRKTAEISQVNASEKVFKEEGCLPDDTSPEVYCEVLKRWIMERKRHETFVTKRTQFELAQILTSNDPLEMRFLRAVNCLGQEPALNRRMILHLFQFLNEVSQHSNENMMPAKNLTTIFHMTLFENLIMKVQPDALAGALQRIQTFVIELIQFPNQHLSGRIIRQGPRQEAYLNGAPLLPPRNSLQVATNRTARSSVQKKWALLVKDVIQQIGVGAFRLGCHEKFRDPSSALVTMKGDPVGLKFTPI